MMVIFMTKDIINVIQIDEELDAEYEAAKVLRKYPKETVMLNNIKGYDIPVVSGICNTREKIAQSLGCQVDEILYKIIDGMNNPTPVSKFIDLSLPITSVTVEHTLLQVLYLQETLKQAFKMLQSIEC